MGMPESDLLVELVASICLSFSLSLPPMSAWGFLCYFFSHIFSHIKKRSADGDKEDVMLGPKSQDARLEFLL